MRSALLGVMLLFSTAAFAQRPVPAPASSAEEKVGSYHVITSQLQPVQATRRLMPQPGIQLNDTTADTPQEYSGTIPVPSNYVIDGLQNPQNNCVDITAQENGCRFVDYASFSITDSNHIFYHVRNHGGRVLLLLNVAVRDLVAQTSQSADSDWYANQVTAFNVLKDTNVLVQGIWNNDSVFFVPGQPLSPDAQKAVQQEGQPQTIGNETIYSYRVKDPGWKGQANASCVDVKTKGACKPAEVKLHGSAPLK